MDIFLRGGGELFRSSSVLALNRKAPHLNLSGFALPPTARTTKAYVLVSLKSAYIVICFSYLRKQAKTQCALNKHHTTSSPFVLPIFSEARAKLRNKIARSAETEKFKQTLTF